LVDGYLVWFHSLATKNSTAINMGILGISNVFWLSFLWLSVQYTQQDHMMVLFLVFWGTFILISTQLY
jgi:hypothetical protein